MGTSGLRRLLARRAGDPPYGNGEVLAGECEAFLAGRWIDDERRSGGQLPRWTWLNLVAHADADALHAIADRRVCTATRRVDDVQVVLARAVLAAVNGPNDLARIQHEILVPLELELLTTPMSPRRMVERVTMALFAT